MNRLQFAFEGRARILCHSHPDAQWPMLQVNVWLLSDVRVARMVDYGLAQRIDSRVHYQASNLALPTASRARSNWQSYSHPFVQREQAMHVTNLSKVFYVHELCHEVASGRTSGCVCDLDDVERPPQRN